MVKNDSGFQILSCHLPICTFPSKYIFDRFLNTDYNKSRMTESGLSVHFSSRRNSWETPQALFDKLNEEFYFELDVCATPENAKCKKYYSPAEDGLKQEWKGAQILNS